MQFAGITLDLTQAKIMAVLNVTPDSFYDGGSYYRGENLDTDLVRTKVTQLLADGADIIDVGGESTRPGAAPVSEQQECDRVLPVVELIAREFNVVISVDTSRAQVMRESARMGAGLINDVRALTEPGALEAAASTGLPVCIMHMQGTPATMQDSPDYQDAVAEVFNYLAERKQACVAAGISDHKVIVDPGIGFGKTDAHNLALISNLKQLSELGPVLLGVSRKSLFGRLLNRPLPDRLAGSLALALRGVEQGAAIVRVHDVAETADAIKMWHLTEQPLV